MEIEEQQNNPKQNKKQQNFNSKNVSVLEIAHYELKALWCAAIYNDNDKIIY